MESTKKTRRGGDFSPKLRASHRILATRIHRRRRDQHGSTACRNMARNQPGGPAHHRRVPLCDDRFLGSRHVRKFAAMARDRRDPSSNGHLTSRMGLFAIAIQPRGLRAARRVSLPPLSVLRELVCRHRTRLSRSACRWVSRLRRAGLGRCRIPIRRSGALRYVAGHASQVLRSRLACTCGER